MKIGLYAGVTILAIFPGVALGADASGQSSDEMSAAEPRAVVADKPITPPAETIVVTATRVPTPITAIPNTVRVLDREAVETQLAVSPSLIDSLSFSIPSLAPGRQRMTSTGESLRGRTPLYLVDGIPQTTPWRDGKRSGFTIDPAFVDRVEVIFGANAIQGLGATGGAINYVTAQRSSPLGLGFRMHASHAPAFFNPPAARPARLSHKPTGRALQQVVAARQEPIGTSAIRKAGSKRRA